MSQPFNKFNCFALDMGNGVHVLGSDTLKFYLTNTAPVATNTVYNTPAEIAAANGYPSGGAAVTSKTWTQAAGLASLVGTGPVFTAAGGPFGPFRYAVLYNFTATAKNLIGWYDYGSSITPADTETFTVTTGASILTDG